MNKIDLNIRNLDMYPILEAVQCNGSIEVLEPADWELNTSFVQIEDVLGMPSASIDN